MADPPATSGLTVRRHHVHCAAPRGAAAAGVQRAVTGGALEARLGAAVASRGLADGYWLVRRLDVDLRSSVVWTESRLLDVLSAAFGQALTTTLSRPSRDGDVRWFRDRAAYLAAFLDDRASGRTAGRWEYAQLDHLTGDLSAVLLALARAEPDHLTAALLDLDDAALVRLLGRLPGRAGQELLTALAPGAATPGRRDLVLAALGPLVRAGLLTGPGGVVLLALTAARAGGVPVSDIATAAADVGLLVAAVLARGDAAPRLLGHVVAGRWREASELLGSTDELLPLVGWPETDRRLLAEAVVGEVRSGLDLSTAYGGMFLLLPLADDLVDWAPLTQGWDPHDGVDPERWLRLLVLAAALDDDGVAPLFDPLLRLALGVPDGSDGWTAPRWLRRHDPDGRLVPETADRLVAELAHRLPGMAGASTQHLRDNVLRFPASATVDPDAGAVTVELGQPPLHVLLSMAGLTRGSFRLATCPEVTWTLSTRG